MYRHDSVASIEEAECAEFSTGAGCRTYCKQGLWEPSIPSLHAKFVVCVRGSSIVLLRRSTILRPQL
jgi:hypothetical protein